MIILPWQLGWKACCGKWAVENAPSLVINVGGGCLAALQGSGCGISNMARLAEDCAIVFANNTCALIHSIYVSSAIFTCSDVRKEGKQQKQCSKISLLQTVQNVNGCYQVEQSPLCQYLWKYQVHLLLFAFSIRIHSLCAHSLFILSSSVSKTFLWILLLITLLYQ